MDLSALREICLSYPFATEDIKWETHLCFNVGEKIFIISSPDTVPVSLSIKVSDEDFISLCEREGIEPAPYLARYKWVLVKDLSLLNKKEWIHYSRKAYDLVYAKLPARIKKSLENK